MSFVKTILYSRQALWLCLAWPAFPLIWDFYEDLRHYPELMLITGLLSIQLLVLSLAITPFSLLTKRWHLMRKVSQWLLVRRRYFGVASFGYGFLHVAFYVRDVASPLSIWLEAFDLPVLVGWIGFLILLLLAVTSNDASIRIMGKRWKNLQRLSYPATFAIFLHWYYFVDFPLDDFQLWTGIVIAAKLLHVAYRFWQKRWALAKSTSRPPARIRFPEKWQATLWIRKSR